MQSLWGRPIGKGLAILLAVIGFAGPLGAAPFIPENDAEVLERLPTTLGGGSGEVRRLRERLARAPTDVARAVAVAGRYIELGQGQSDPRYYGYAQAALEPWWGLADPPPEVLLLRAAIRQGRHEFDAALQDLSRLLEKDPRDPQAWLMQAVIFIVRADYPAARRACEALARLRRAFLAFSCMGSLASLSGQAEGGYDLLRLAEDQSQNATLGERVRLETLLGKTAERLGDWGRAEGHFQEARRLGPHDAYLLGAYADLLLDQGRAQEVVALLREETRVDGLLLRLSLAERDIGAPGKEAHIEDLRARYAASRQRGDTLHQGEEARFLLHLVDQPQAALTLAKANWAVQREPRDARILIEAALASGQPEAARPVLEMIERTGLQDLALRRLANEIQAKDPPNPPLRRGGTGGSPR
ncbi:MAG: tetratricopeptide repeat protein [Gammaproteobacteria bacterium]